MWEKLFKRNLDEIIRMRGSARFTYDAILRLPVIKNYYPLSNDDHQKRF